MTQNILVSIKDKIKTAIDRIKNFEPDEGYYLAFSGGKDSVVLKALADMAGVKYDAHYNMTTIDPPDLVKFIREKYPDVIIDRPAKSFFALLPSKGFPLRQSRWCCEELKEKGGKNRFVLTGIRHAESPRRKKRSMVEACDRVQKRFLHPIIDWDNNDVWEFIKLYKINYCRLYDEGWTRIGCIACPMQSSEHKIMELTRYPNIEKALRLSFKKLYDNRKRNKSVSVDRWGNSDEMFDWWISGNPAPEKDENQCEFVFEP